MNQPATETRRSQRSRPLFGRTLLLAMMLAGTAKGAVAERPHIVFILIDDLRWDTFSFLNHPFVETPHIDALASGGLQFRRAFVTTSLCSPSRASFLTGQYMHRHRVVDNADLMPRGTVTFPQLLQADGYTTAFIGKWHMGGSSDAPRPGFDHWVSFRGQGTYAPDRQHLNVDGAQIPRQKYMTDELTDYAIRWLQDRPGSQPLLLYLSHKGVHGLYDPAPRHRDRYAGQPVPAPPSSVGEQPLWVQDQRNSWHGVEYPYHGRSGQSVAQMYRHYCEMILSIDDSVGQVMAALKQRDIDRNTLVIFTSDGGHLWGEHGLIDKRCAYEESMRIPLLMHWPAMIRAGGRCDQLVSNIDLAPTLLEAAGLSPPATMDGRSFLPLLSSPDQQDPNRTALLYEYYWEPAFPQTPTMFALRTDRWKLIQHHGIWDTDELFDLHSDPGETTNLIHDREQQQRVKRLRRQLYERLQESDGLRIPLGFKRGPGASRRRSDASRRAEFPDRLVDDPPRGDARGS